MASSTLRVTAQMGVFVALLCLVPSQAQAQAPVLTSVAPGFVAQGARHYRLTLIGNNFAQGATVLISPPVEAVSDSIVPIPATDFVVETITLVNSRTLVVLVSANPDAIIGLRAVDVVNPDGMNTGFDPGLGSATSQPLRVTLGTSLAAPLQAQTIAITHPRNGTLLSLGDDLYAEAMIGGVGTGTIAGEWLWDGAVIEQFANTMAGGERLAIRTTRSLPTLYIGPHTLEVRIFTPNMLQSRPITVVVNPGDWRAQRLLAPPPGKAFATGGPPLLAWALVAGAARYEVGFSSQPYFNTVETWHEVGDTRWQVPKGVWEALPEGELYWTVRVVETSGLTRKPLPMRRIYRIREGLLAAARPPQRAQNGALVLEWEGLPKATIYRVSVSRDAEGRDVVRRFLAASPKVELRSLRNQLQPGVTYYWRVEAFTPDGRQLLVGPPQSFVAGPSPAAQRTPSFRTREVASLAVMPPPALADELMARVPSPGDTVASAQPEISVEFKNPISAGDTSISVDDTDLTSVAQFTEKKMSVNPPLALANGERKITLQVGAESIEWKFTVKAALPPAPPPAPTEFAKGSDAEAEPPAGAPATPPTVAAGAPTPGVPDEFSTQLSSNTQWISGRDAGEQDTNVLAAASRMTFQNGPWRFEGNGSGLLNSVLAPIPRSSLGRVNDYVFRLTRDGPKWGGILAFGILAPSLYTDSEFVTTAQPREGVEPVLRTPAGSFGFYANTRDLALGGGSGVAFHQQLLGAAYTAPLPKDRATLRVMWLSARDDGTPTTIAFDSLGKPIPGKDLVAKRGAGDAYGALLRVHLGGSWMWTSEYAWSYLNPDLGSPASDRFFGRAWRSGIMGTVWKTNVAFMFRDVGPSFGSPANPSLSKTSNPDRRGFDSMLSRPTKIGTWTASYQYLQSDVRSAERPQINLHNLFLGWSKNVTTTTVIAANGRLARTFTGELPPPALLLPADQQLALKSSQRNAGVQLSVMQRVGSVSLTAAASRDWFHNHLITGQDVITSSVNFGAAWQGGSFFRLQSNLSVNWVAADKNKVGTRRVITTYIQPMLTWQRTHLSVAPLITVSKTLNELASGTRTDDTLSTQYGGRLSWQMPGPLKFSTLSLEGLKTRVNNAILPTETDDARVLLLWTLVWGRNWTAPGAPR